MKEAQVGLILGTLLGLALILEGFGEMLSLPWQVSSDGSLPGSSKATSTSAS